MLPVILGGIVGSLLGAAEKIYSSKRTHDTWRETHRTIAPKVGDAIDRVSNAGANAITNTNKGCLDGLSVIGKKAILFGGVALSNILISESHKYLSDACKDNPNSMSCTAADYNSCAQMFTTTLLVCGVGTMLYKYVSDKGEKNNRHSTDEDDRNSIQRLRNLDNEFKNLGRRELRLNK